MDGLLLTTVSHIFPVNHLLVSISACDLSGCPFACQKF